MAVNLDYLPQTFARPANLATRGSSISTSPRSALLAFGLPSTPFTDTPLPPKKAAPLRPMGPISEPQEGEKEARPLDIAGALRPLQAQQEASERGRMDKLEAAIRGIPAAPPPYEKKDAGRPVLTTSPAMNPTEGPDTGADNPNAAGLDDTYYGRLRGPEGTLANYDAVNPTTGASGPYQFLRSTWQDLMRSNPELGLTMAGFMNPSANKGQHEAAIRAYSDRSLQAARAQLGRIPTAGEMYAMHLLGQGGGLGLLNSLDRNVSDIIPSYVIDANSALLRPFASKSGRELLKHFEKIMGSKS